MYDRDIQLMQAIAALMDPNKFIIHILDKYNLASAMQWVLDKYNLASAMQWVLDKYSLASAMPC